MNGPRSVEDAFRSPLWSRILIAEKGKASNLFIFLKYPVGGSVVQELESIQDRFSRPGFELVVSGPLYVSEMIQRNLFRDLRIFSLVSFLMFGTAILLIFRSVWMVVGAVVACLVAAAATLIVDHLLGVRIGLLTANLVTILFVMMIEHIIFFTFNWRHLLEQ